MIQNHAHRTGPDFRREFVRRLACQELEPPAIPGRFTSRFHDGTSHVSKTPKTVAKTPAKTNSTTDKIYIGIGGWTFAP